MLNLFYLLWILYTVITLVAGLVIGLLIYCSRRDKIKRRKEIQDLINSSQTSLPEESW
jgi:uncharacterized membrane-anchored protein YhcB (DUF1043 family)